MRKTKNEIEYNPKEYMDIFEKHKNKIAEYQYYEKMYDDIRTYYEEKIKDDENFINIERVRLQSKTGKYNTLTRNVNINIIILAVSFLVNNLALAFSVSSYQSESKFYIIFGFSLIAYGLLLLMVRKNIKNNDTFILDLALQALNDIEKNSNNKDEQVNKDRIDKILENIEQIKKFLGI